ncbi:alginate lyase family protein [Zestomonas carbonaria]|uniref:Alginate lyase n=1 Tax=Zestomonas carbonaria TaxID=2762745 RepID=A0A7U7EMR0_9GAMM|nr:alginate lyase family protein [Pseudomonas carbonaria]CAD5107302.1 Alginate lyase [Pseudomonas carbonaria]
MPVKHLGALLLASGLLLGAAPGDAALRSIWQPTGPAPAALDYHGLSCRKPAPAAYTGPLQIDSKYDQSDQSKSTLSARPASEASQRAYRSAGEYTKTLVSFADYYLRAETPGHASMALACIDQWLQAWAEPGALTSRDASKTGIAVRKWSLAAIAAVILKTQALSHGQLQLSHEQRQWLDDLASLVVDDYAPRLEPGFRYFNNHDYWAAWALAATAMILDQPRYLDLGEKIMRRALEQITPGADGQYAYLPNELARGKLAANYTHYALVPLVLLADALRVNGARLSADDERRLALLANFAATSVLAPQRLTELNGQRQSPVEPYKMAWLIPFLSHSPEHELARRLYRAEDGAVDGYSQIGGRIAPFYPDLQGR